MPEIKKLKYQDLARTWSEWNSHTLLMRCKMINGTSIWKTVFIKMKCVPMAK